MELEIMMLSSDKSHVDMYRVWRKLKDKEKKLIGHLIWTKYNNWWFKPRFTGGL